MNYEELEKHLQNNHFYPNKTYKLGTEEITMLSINADSIIGREKEPIIKELLKDFPYKVQYMPNSKQIHITKKK